MFCVEEICSVFCGGSKMFGSNMGIPFQGSTCKTMPFWDTKKELGKSGAGQAETWTMLWVTDEPTNVPNSATAPTLETEEVWLTLLLHVELVYVIWCYLYIRHLHGPSIRNSCSLFRQRGLHQPTSSTSCFQSFLSRVMQGKEEVSVYVFPLFSFLFFFLYFLLLFSFILWQWI